MSLVTGDVHQSQSENTKTVSRRCTPFKAWRWQRSEYKSVFFRAYEQDSKNILPIREDSTRDWSKLDSK